MYFVGANKYHDHKSEVYGKYDFASVNLKVFWVHRLLNTHFCDKILTVSSTCGRRGSKANFVNIASKQVSKIGVCRKRQSIGPYYIMKCSGIVPKA